MGFLGLRFLAVWGVEVWGWGLGFRFFQGFGVLGFGIWGSVVVLGFRVLGLGSRAWVFFGGSS